ncbi:MAG: helix-turn-helix transcriptional regulator [Bacilli bacterium]|nr:helix-turn-helix transcriptional regulator [Bacilli bacterium]
MAKNITLGDYILQTRESKNLSLSDLSRLSGVDRSVLSRVEKGKRKQPNVLMLTKIANALDIDKYKLFKLAGYNDINILINTFGDKDFDTDDDIRSKIHQLEKDKLDILDSHFKNKEIVRSQRNEIGSLISNIQLGEMSNEEIIGELKKINEGLLSAAMKYKEK